MKDYIDDGSKANEIRMLLGHPSFENRVIVLLEGDTDIRLFRTLLNHNIVKFEATNTKDAVIQIVNELTVKEGYASQLIGICDAEFDHILGVKISRHNIFVTDTHDAETMILQSPATEALIAEYAVNEESRILLTEQLIHSTVRAAFIIGIFRLMNKLHHLNLNFKNLHFDLFSTFNGLDIEVDIENLADELRKRSPRIPSHADNNYLLSMYYELANNEFDRMQICCGHDVTKFISFVLRQRSLSNDANINQNKVERSLRLSYTLEYFQETRLCKALGDWQQANSELQVVL